MKKLTQEEDKTSDGLTNIPAAESQLLVLSTFDVRLSSMLPTSYTELSAVVEAISWLRFMDGRLLSGFRNLETDDNYEQVRPFLCALPTG